MLLEPQIILKSLPGEAGVVARLRVRIASYLLLNIHREEVGVVVRLGMYHPRARIGFLNLQFQLSRQLLVLGREVEAEGVVMMYHLRIWTGYLKL